MHSFLINVFVLFLLKGSNSISSYILNEFLSYYQSYQIFFLTDKLLHKTKLLIFIKTNYKNWSMLKINH